MYLMSVPEAVSQGFPQPKDPPHAKFLSSEEGNALQVKIVAFKAKAKKYED